MPEHRRQRSTDIARHGRGLEQLLQRQRRRVLEPATHVAALKASHIDHAAEAKPAVKQVHNADRDEEDEEDLGHEPATQAGRPAQPPAPADGCDAGADSPRNCLRIAAALAELTTSTGSVRR